MPSMNRAKFLEGYEYAAEVDWSLEGMPSKWATSSTKDAHRLWGQEDAKITLFSAEEPPEITGRGHSVATIAAVSPDDTFLAASTGNKINLYRLDSRTKVAEFEGPLEDVRRLYFRPGTITYKQEGSSSVYLLVSEHSDLAGIEKGVITLWDIDKDGKPLQQVTDHLDVSALARQSLNAIKPQLSERYSVEADSEMVNQVLKAYEKALQPIAASIRIKGLKTTNGRLPGFDSKPFSSDGKYMACTNNNTSTQHGMRSPDDLPHIIIYDLDTNETKHSLGGHTDAIMFLAFSPDSQTLASAAWDGTFCLWSTSTGALLHKVGPIGSQCWDGCFAPDSKTILFSGMASSPNSEGIKRNHPFVALYDVATCAQIAEFKDERMRHWVRVLDINKDNSIAIACDADLWIWRPLGAGGNTDPEKSNVACHFQLAMQEPIQRGFLTISQATWVDEGRKLVVVSGDDTVEVLDVVTNVKWRFQRPKGSKMVGSGHEAFWLGNDELAVLNGDGAIRFWKL